MKSESVYGTLLVLFALVFLPGFTTCSKPPPNIFDRCCKNTSNVGFYPDYGANPPCSSYCNCGYSGESVIQYIACPPGLFFNVRIRSCDSILSPECSRLNPSPTNVTLANKGVLTDGYIPRAALKSTGAVGGLLQQTNKNTNFRFTDVDGKPDVDWRSLYMTPVKNQDECNACWAMSVVAAVEAAQCISDGPPCRELSTQELLDCMPAHGSSCNGGDPNDALQYIAQNGGLNWMEYYPSSTTQGVVKSGEKCISTEYEIEGTQVLAWEEVPALDPTSLQAVVSSQPVIVSIASDWLAFKAYTSEGPEQILSDPNLECPTYVNHNLLIVGYGNNSEGQPYWIARNSWGQEWGDRGDAYLERSTDLGPGLCSMLQTPPVYPVMDVVMPPPEDTSGSLCDYGIENNMCGVGDCTSGRRINETDFVDDSTSYYCVCPDTHAVVLQSSGKESCVYTAVCNTTAYNPCLAGDCTDDNEGGYTCECNPGYHDSTYPNGNEVCRPVDPVQNVINHVYKIKDTDTCDILILKSGWSPYDFRSNNKNICREQSTGPDNLKVGSEVIFAPPTPGVTCATYYTTIKGDTCDSVALLFTNTTYDTTLSRKTLDNLNPGWCQALSPGIDLCVEGGNVALNPDCGHYYLTKSGDTCKSIIDTYIDAFSFFTLNFGLDCSVLKQQPGTEVCVQSTNAGTGSNCLPCPSENPWKVRQYGMKLYTVQTGDTCASLAHEHFHCNPYLISCLNFGLQCSERTVFRGVTLCRPAWVGTSC